VNTLRLLAQNLIIIMILAVFLEIMLPGTEMRKYVKMVLGLMVIIAIIQAGNGFSAGLLFSEINDFAWRGAQEKPGVQDIMRQGQAIDRENHSRALEKYRDALAKQVSALAELDDQVSIIDTSVQLNDNAAENNFGQIETINLYLGPKSRNGGIKEVETVSVSMEKNADNAPGEEIPPEYVPAVNNTVKIISNFYNLSPEQIKVRFKQRG